MRVVFFFFKQKTAYEMRISDGSSDVCSSDLEDKSALFQQIAIMGVHFIAMAVSLADVLIFIDRSDDAIPSQFGGISAKAHGAAQIAARFAFLQPFFTHPFRDEAHNRFVRRAKFGGGCLRKSGHIARTLDAGQLHAKTTA